MSEPPHKRRRLPDGFSAPAKTKVVAPKFESAFGQIDASFTPKKPARQKPAVYAFPTTTCTPKKPHFVLHQSTPLKHLKPPVLRPPSPKPLKSITATSFTLQPSTDALQPSETDIDRRIKRGVDFSPQKSAKFIRRGLAAQASAVLDQHHKSHSLWISDTARALATNKAAPDLRFTILKVIHVPSVPSMSGLALCATVLEDQCLLLLSFTQTSTTPICNPARFAEGRQLWVWKPWHNTSMGTNRVFISDRFAILD